jgi:hypothetical protein
MATIQLSDNVPAPVAKAIQDFARKVEAVHDPDGEKDGRVSAAELLAVVDSAVAVVVAIRSA